MEGQVAAARLDLLVFSDPRCLFSRDPLLFHFSLRLWRDSPTRTTWRVRSPRRDTLVSASERHTGGCETVSMGHQRPSCDADCVSPVLASNTASRAWGSNVVVLSVSSMGGSQMTSGSLGRSLGGSPPCEGGGGDLCIARDG